MTVIRCYCGKCDKNICFGQTKLTPLFSSRAIRDKSQTLANKDKIIFQGSPIKIKPKSPNLINKTKEKARPSQYKPST